MYCSIRLILISSQVNLDSEDEGEKEAPPVVEEENIFDNDNPTIEVALSWYVLIYLYFFVININIFMQAWRDPDL